MNSFLNEEQQDHVKELAKIPASKKCYCGWYRHGDCPDCDIKKTNADKIKEDLCRDKYI